MDFGESIRTCLSKYATFSGRASRSEYWWFQLFGIAMLAVFLVLFAALANISDSLVGVGWVVAALAYLALILPSLSVLVRRLHDTDRSGWWYWISLLPFGGIVLLVFLCMQGTAGDNDYGHDPLSDSLADTFR